MAKAKSHFRVYKRKQVKRVEKPTSTRFRTVETFVNGRRERIEQYPADITWQEAKQFQRDVFYNLPDITVEPEYQVTGETAHFEGSSRLSGWGVLLVEGEAVSRVRCWEGCEGLRPLFCWVAYGGATLPQQTWVCLIRFGTRFNLSK